MSVKKRLKQALVGGLFAFLVASPVMAVTAPQVSTASAAADCEGRVLGIPPWYRGLTKSSSCDLKTINSTDGAVSGDSIGLTAFIWTVVLNVIEMAIVIIAYISVFFIIYGGFLYMTGGSNPGQVEKARKSITNALIGLVVAMGAIAITNLLFSVIS